MKILAAIILTTCLMSILAEVQEQRAFDMGVRTVLCTQSTALGQASPACGKLSSKQRAYAVRVGREIAEQAK